MIAPSEKHLEDWIVDNSQLVREETGESCDYWDGYTNFIHRIVNRQVRLPSGRADLIAITCGYTDISVAPVEIKKGAIDSKTVAQCLRYMRDLREIFLRVRHPGIDSEIYTGYEYRPHGIAEQLLGYAPEIAGMVIGHSVSDNNLLVACEASGIAVLTYEFDGTGYEFTSHSDANHIGNQDHYSNFAYGAVGDAIREVMKSRFEDEQRKQGGAK